MAQVIQQHPQRLIPAHAGSTWWSPSSRLVSWAHPRSRGEHIDRVLVLARGVGSSPLTRGAPRGVREALCEGRLIPAHAGSTCHLGIAAALY